MTKVTEGTWPKGSEWARDPIPGCKTCEDAHATCGDPLTPVPLNETGGGYRDAWNTQVNCYGSCCGASSSKAHGVCPDVLPCCVGSFRIWKRRSRLVHHGSCCDS